MGSIWIREFTGGLDTRRLPETSPGGVLIEARDGHITRGGEFEQRAAFVPEYQLPAGTLGLAYDRTGPVTFGSGPAPTGMPDGVRYQRLQHPGGFDLVRVLSSDLYAGKLYVAALYSDGGNIHFYDGTYVSGWYDGRARAPFNVVGGSAGATIQVFVNGVAASGVVPWNTSPTQTAADIAQSITARTSSPEYVANSSGARVNLLAAQAGATPNGYSVTFVTEGNLTVQLLPAGTTDLTMQGGASPENTYQPGSFVKTAGSKVYSVSGPNLHFSGIRAPDKWTTDATGAGFVDMSAEVSGAEELLAVARYQDALAIFAERVIQVWYVDPDPALNKQLQTLNNTGTASAQSVTQFGDNDLFYLDESGLRSLRARDASNAAATSDIGVPIDTLIVAKLAELSDQDRSRIVGLIEPRDGRFWLIAKDLIFVFSYFPGSKVSAWSTYVPGFDVEAAAVIGRRVYLRSGDTVYVYGGLGDVPVHDDTPAIARTPYLDGNAPSVAKTLQGFDLAGRGEWEVSVAMDPSDEDVHELVATIDRTTFPMGRVPMVGEATHIGLILRSKGQGPHRLGSIVLHYEGGAEG